MVRRGLGLEGKILLSTLLSTLLPTLLSTALLGWGLVLGGDLENSLGGDFWARLGILGEDALGKATGLLGTKIFLRYLKFLWRRNFFDAHLILGNSGKNVWGGVYVF